MSDTIVAQNKRTVKNHRTLLAKAATHDVRPFDIPGTDISGWVVTSGSSGNEYMVAPVSPAADGDESPGLGCECKWATQGGHYAPWTRVSACSHVQKAQRYLASLGGKRVYTHATPEEAMRQHRQVVEVSAQDGVWYTIRSDMGPAPVDQEQLERIAQVNEEESQLLPVGWEARGDVDLYQPEDWEGFD